MRVFLSLVSLVVLTAPLLADVFIAGDHEVEIEFVRIGNPGNVADTTGVPNPAGSVDYEYRIAKYEFTRGEALAIFQAGNLATFNADPIFFGDYSFLEELPADIALSGISWNNAARIVNWMNASKGFPPAYNYRYQPGHSRYRHNDPVLNWEPDDPGYNEDNPLRSSLAHYFLPTDDEWYKAAYFDPELNKYWDYPTGSDEPPTPVVSGTDPNTAVFAQPLTSRPSIAPVTQAGGLSAYGVMGMGGNTDEWNEAEFPNNLGHPWPPISRGVRGCASECEFARSLATGHSYNFFQEFGGPGLRVVSTLLDFDCNNDGIVNIFDAHCTPELDVFLDEHNYPLGDVDGNRVVEFADFLVLSSQFGTDANYTGGDLDRDGVVTFADFLNLSQNFGAATVAPVPEPNGCLLFVVGVGVVFLRFGRKN